MSGPRLLVISLLALVVSSCAGNVQQLEVGNCFDDTSDLVGEGITEVLNLPIVDCAQPHDNEVYHAVEATHDDYPGQEALAEEADQICLGAFEPFVGISYAESELDFGWLIPTPDSWDQGDRQVVCFLYRLDLEPITGSMQGSGI